MERTGRVGSGQDRDDMLPFVKGPHLFGAADFGEIGPFAQYRNQHLAAVERSFDVFTPGSTAGNPVRVGPSVAADGVEGVAEVMRRAGAIFPRVRDEHATGGPGGEGSGFGA